MIKSINSIKALSLREFQIIYKNFSDIFSVLLFFLLGIVIFVFGVGIDNQIFDQIGVGIIWTLILLSNTLYIKKIFQNDFEDNNIALFHMGGLSYELIVIIKVFITWICLQIPFFVIIPLAIILLNIEFSNLKIIYISFLIGSPIITCITAMSASLNLLNKKNFAVGSLIIMIFSIPVIIFSSQLTNATVEMADAQLKILLGVMFFFISITPWICSICIKIALQYK